MKRVVITGVGVISPIGNNAGDFFDSLVKGRSGIREITAFDASNHPTHIAAEVRDFIPENYFDIKEVKKHDRFSQFAIVAADEAISQSGFLQGIFDPHRVGVYIGSGIGGILTLESTCEAYASRGVRGVSPFFVSNLISNLAGGNLAIKHGFKGNCYCIVSACATATHSIGEAFREVAMGTHDIMIAGGAEAAITPLTVAGFANMKAMSRRNEIPHEASCPYDLRRDGFVMGEGAGILVLESYEHAAARGAEILAEICGYGASCDAYHITAVAPGGEGVLRASQIALNMAGLNPDQVDYVNSHGTSTPIGDKFETEFIKALFKEHSSQLWVSSTKSMVGHLLGAAGGVESVACVKTLLSGVVHPTMNLCEPDPECDLDYVPNHSREKDIKVILKNSMGFGGQNAVLVMKKFE